MLVLVALKIETFFRAVCDDVVSRYGSTKMRYESDHTGKRGSFIFRWWTLSLSLRLFQLVDEHDVDLELCYLASARANAIDFVVAEEPGWLSF